MSIRYGTRDNVIKVYVRVTMAPTFGVIYQNHPINTEHVAVVHDYFFI